ncbi:MAG TPA: vWA domain-containing protein [Woeseiaceae bacterium]|nr:vWA domain-containing protein [Woeseiaceae bacterium]
MKTPARKSTAFAVALVALTVGAVAYYPELMARNTGVDDPRDDDPLTQQLVAAGRPQVDVVFVLDTTGSMGGLIATAKEKIWSIATSMSSARQTPDIRIGLVAYRDKGDAYVTKVIDLSTDLDTVYATLMDFAAEGGGDGPESVNEALYDAVHDISWTQAENAYKAIFLVGDAPPHMDYNEMRYPEIAAAARQRNIVINTVQCGSQADTVAPWTRIASLGQGSYFQVEQAGGAVALATPFDEEIATLSAKLDETRLYYGSREEQRRMHDKVAATEKLHESASLSARARRAAFNASAAGDANRLGENELVDAVASGRVDLDAIAPATLPAVLQPMAPEEQKAYVQELAKTRDELEATLAERAKARDEYLAKKVEEAGGLEDSLDRQLFDAVREQAAAAGLEYDGGPAY